MQIIGSIIFAQTGVVKSGANDAGSAPTDEAVTQVASALTDPVSVCNQDPRVNSNLVPLAVCAGARVFFDEKFNGNGRTTSAVSSRVTDAMRAPRQRPPHSFGVTSLTDRP